MREDASKGPSGTSDDVQRVLLNLSPVASKMHPVSVVNVRMNVQMRLSEPGWILFIMQSVKLFRPVVVFS